MYTCTLDIAHSNLRNTLVHPLWEKTGNAPPIRNEHNIVQDLCSNARNEWMRQIKNHWAVRHQQQFSPINKLTKNIPNANDKRLRKYYTRPSNDAKYEEKKWKPKKNSCKNG